MTALTPAQRQANRTARQKAAGLVRVSEWIPDTKAARQAIKALAAKLRKEQL
jgi:hypothetical protein